MGLFAAKLLIFAPIQFAQNFGFIPGVAQDVTGAVFLQKNQNLKLRRDALHIFSNLPGRELPNPAVSNVQFGTTTSTLTNLRPMRLALQNVF